MSHFGHVQREIRKCKFSLQEVMESGKEDDRGL